MINYLKKSYINLFFFDLINQNYLLIFNIRNMELISYFFFSLPIFSFDFFDYKFFNSFFFLEWFSGYRPFLLKNKLICHLRKKNVYNFLNFFQFFILKNKNMDNLNFNSKKLFFEFNIKSYRRIPFLPSIFYNFKIKLNCVIKFNFIFSKLSNSQKRNYLIFFFNNLNEIHSI